ncbi:MAG: TonB-dependent receptor [Brevinematia bacterium]
MERLIFILAIASLMLAFDFSSFSMQKEEINISGATNTNSAYNYTNATSKWLNIPAFEKVVVGTLCDKKLPLTTFDVRKYPKKGLSMDISDYLQSIPDILTPNYYGSEGSLTVLFTPRGDKVNIAINDLDISTVVNSSYDASLLDPLFFNSVEILYGPTSSRYGSGNYGGVVNFNLVDEEEPRLRAIVGTGLPRKYFISADLVLTNIVGKLYLGASYGVNSNLYHFNVSTLYTNYSTLEPTNYIREGAGYTKYSFLLRYLRSISGFNMDIGFLSTYPRVQEPNSVLAHNPLNYEKAVSEIRFLLPYIKLDYEHGDSKIGLKVFYTEHLRNRRVEVPRISFYGTSIGSEIYGGKAFVEIEAKTRFFVDPLNAIFLGGTVSYSHNLYSVVNTNLVVFIVTNTNETKTNASSRILGLYLEGDYALSELLRFTLSGRVDYVEFNNIEFSPRLGILITPTELFGIRSSAWRSYRLPYFDDLYGPVAYGFGSSALTNLQTEYMNGLDFGIFIDYKLKKCKLYFSAVTYYSDTTNLIAWNNTTFSTENIGKVFNRGINLLSKISYGNSITSLISYTYNESINGNASDNVKWNRVVFLNYRPLNSLYVDLAYDQSTLGGRIYINYQWNRFEYEYDSSFNIVGNRSLDNLMTLSVAVWNKPLDWLEIGAEWKRNIIGNEYTEGYPTPEEKITLYTLVRLW